MSKENYFETSAIPVKQPLGEFFICKIPAGVLLEITYSNELRVLDKLSEDGTYKLIGAQRQEREERLKDIGRYINTVESAFPNSVILAANYDRDGNFINDEDLRWEIRNNGSSACKQLLIPKKQKIASIIDGQHRLHAFEYAKAERLNMELLCAVYLDLPNPYQASLFATINFNQKKVDRSLAYELWGFDIEEEASKSWTPEKTAVYFSRKLNTDSNSPLYNHIIVAPINDDLLFEIKPEEVSWVVSTATVVDGILSLFSSNTKKDRDIMLEYKLKEGRHRSILRENKHDRSPLRDLFISINDKAIYTALINFFKSVEKNLWQNQNTEDSYIFKTVGIQALFDVLKKIMEKFSNDKDISVGYFDSFLVKSQDLNFKDDFFQASGIGKTRIKNSILLKSGLISKDKLPKKDKDSYLGYLNDE